MRTDRAVIRKLTDILGSYVNVAKTLGIPNPQSLCNWRHRGVPPGWRTVIFDWCRENGHDFVDEQWCEASGDPLEAALRRALRRAAQRPKSGGDYGGEGEGKSREVARA